MIVELINSNLESYDREITNLLVGYEVGFAIFINNISYQFFTSTPITSFIIWILTSMCPFYRLSSNEGTINITLFVIIVTSIFLSYFRSRLKSDSKQEGSTKEAFIDYT